MADGSWLSMFIERNGDNGYDDGLDGWLTASGPQDGVIRIRWEPNDVDDCVLERYKVTRID